VLTLCVDDGQGHFFGEFSLLREEPRNANVRAVDNVICVFVTKEVFKPFVESDVKFKQMIAELMLRREEVIKKRSKLSHDSSHRLMAGLKPRESDVKMSQLVRGDRDMVNEYVIIKKLGQGAFGQVKLVQSLKTRGMYAMKMIDRKLLRKKRLGMSDEVRVRHSLGGVLCPPHVQGWCRSSCVRSRL